MKPETLVLLTCHDVFSIPGTWIQGVGNNGYRCCAQEATGNVPLLPEDGFGVDDSFGVRILALLFLRGVTGERDIISWNDTPGRTQEEVAAAFLQAAILSEAV